MARTIRFLLFFGAAGATVPAALPAAAQVPLQMPIQGVLRDNAGAPVMDGSYEVTFSLYEAEDVGNAVWIETWPPAGTSCAQLPEACVQATGGVFAVQLGTHVPLQPAVFRLFDELWLGMSVEGEPELPRRRLGTSAWAFHSASAKTAYGLDCTGCVAYGALAASTVTSLTNQALAAVAAAGYLKDQGPVTEDDLPADGLNEVSNGLLTNEFVHTQTHPGTPFGIPDANLNGVAAFFEVPDIGIAETLRIFVTIGGSSNVGELAIELMDPNGEEYVLFDGGKTGSFLDMSWPDQDPVVDGTLEGWFGADPSGLWLLVVTDGAPDGVQFDGQVVEWGLEAETISSQKVAVAGDLVVKSVEVEGSLEIGGDVSVDGDLDLQNHELRNARFHLAAAPPVPCDPAHLGFFYFNTTDNTLEVCIGGEFRRISTAVCGDGVTEAGEVCDDGNLQNDDGCNVGCIVENGWECSGAPLATCQKLCGNGVIAATEACDDGNDQSNDGCSAGCLVETGWSCTGAGPSTCKTVCGDGYTVPGHEACDDSNQLGCDGCSSNCKAITSLLNGWDYQGVCLVSNALPNNSDNVPAGCSPYQPNKSWGQSDYVAICQHFNPGTGCGSVDTDADGGLCSNFQAIASWENNGSPDVWLHSSTFNYQPTSGSQNCNIKSDDNSTVVYACQ